MKFKKIRFVDSEIFPQEKAKSLNNDMLSVPEGIDVSYSNDYKTLSQGVITQDLNEATSYHAEHISYGAHFVIPEDISIAEPIRYTPHLTDTLVDHIVIEVKAGGHGVFIEESSSNDAAIARHQVVEIILHAHATFDFVRFQCFGKHTQNISHIHSKVHTDAKLNMFSASFGSQKSHVSIINHLVGRRANAEVRKIIKTQEKQHIDLYVENTYDAEHVTGEMLVNCAANDASTISCEGMIKITKNGQFTDSYLKQNTLLLHKNARVDSVPSLEIDANEVKAGHGSAISRVKDSDVFYLQSRGINKKDAQNMYVHGFLQSMTKDFSSIPYVAERTMDLVGR